MSGAVSTACRIGCQGWAHQPWVGRFFTAGARREDFLPQYASVFAAVEGNATFYALPPVETVAKWAEEAPAQLRFCFKFPKTISHERRLVDARAETAEFFARVAPLGPRLGTFFLQLHESFGARGLPALEAYLRGLPKEFAYAVEVRHADFFDHGPHEQALTDLLGGLGVDRVTFDTRGLIASDATDEITAGAKRRKPRTPVRFTATGRRPFVRFVGDPDVAKNIPALREWADQVARWIGDGRTPYFFAHHPDDTYAPHVAREFQRLLHERTATVPAPAAWPVEQEPPPPRGDQLSLF